MKPATVSRTVSTNPPVFDDEEELEEARSPNVEAATFKKSIFKVEMQRTGLFTGSK